MGDWIITAAPAYKCCIAVNETVTIGRGVPGVPIEPTCNHVSRKQLLFTHTPTHELLVRCEGVNPSYINSIKMLSRGSEVRLASGDRVTVKVSDEATLDFTAAWVMAVASSSPSLTAPDSSDPQMLGKRT